MAGYGGFAEGRVRVELDEGALARVAFKAREESLIRYAAHVVFFIQLVCPVGMTGHLRRSIERGLVEGNADAIWVVANAAYGIYVQRGTGIHAVGGGGRRTPWVYFNKALNRFIWTDGTRPQPFMTTGLDMAAAEGIG
jgi:hypothetical protein